MARATIQWYHGAVQQRDPTMPLSMLAVALVNLAFIAAILHHRSHEPHLLSMVATALFYATLYFRRRLLHHHRRGAALLRRGLGYAALALGSFLSALFVYSFAAAATPLPVGVAVGLGFAVSAYSLYRVIVLHLEDEDGDAAAQAMEANVAPPVY